MAGKKQRLQPPQAFPESGAACQQLGPEPVVDRAIAYLGNLE